VGQGRAPSSRSARRGRSHIEAPESLNNRQGTRCQCGTSDHVSTPMPQSPACLRAIPCLLRAVAGRRGCAAGKLSVARFRAIRLVRSRAVAADRGGSVGHAPREGRGHVRGACGHRQSRSPHRGSSPPPSTARGPRLNAKRQLDVSPITTSGATSTPAREIGCHVFARKQTRPATSVTRTADPAAGRAGFGAPAEEHRSRWVQLQEAE